MFPKIKAFLRWFREDLWHEDLRSLSQPKRFFIAALRVGTHVFKNFFQDLGTIQAAGMTLVTLLSLVPLLALSFSIANGLGYGEELRDQFFKLGQETPQFANLFEGLRAIVEKTNFAALGVVGSVVVIWTALVLFIRVEQAFNHVWKTKKSRSWLRRITDFVALVMFVPPMVLVALVSNSVLSNPALAADINEYVPFIGWAVEAGLGIVPHIVLWAAFTALYRLMPSAPVRWKPAFVGGVFAGSGVLLVQSLYVRLQLGISGANALYGTLAALPLLLVYLQTMWTIILLGAEISYAVQNLRLLRGLVYMPESSFEMKQRMAWHIVTDCADRFRNKMLGSYLPQIGAKLDVPREWLDEVAERLIASDIVVRAEKDPEILMPGLPLEDLTWNEVYHAVEGDRHPRFKDSAPLPEEAERKLHEVRAAVDKALKEQTF